MRVHDRNIGRARERERAGERLEQEAAERVHVSTSVDLVAADLLGRDVVDGSHELPVGRPGVTGALCQPEVGEICVLAAALLVEQDVGRLHVAVDEPLCVRRVERVRDLGGDRDDPPRRQRALPPEQRLQVGPVHVAHRDEQAAVGLARLVDRHDVRVVETRGQPRLAQHPVAERLVVREPLAQQLEGDRALEAQVESAVHLAHAAAPGQSADLVAGDEITRRNPFLYCHRPSRVVVAGCTIAVLEAMRRPDCAGRRSRLIPLA